MKLICSICLPFVLVYVILARVLVELKSIPFLVVCDVMENINAYIKHMREAK